MAATLQTDQADDQTRPDSGKLKVTIEAGSDGFSRGELNGTLTGTIDDGAIWMPNSKARRLPPTGKPPSSAG
jgi:hypothetical protein